MEHSTAIVEDKAIRLGHPSYVWRFGQDRRLGRVQRYLPLENRRILDVGCGLGMYVRQFRQFTPDVYGVDIDAEKIDQASRTLPYLSVSPAERLPFEDDFFDVTFLHEVIEHVDDDVQAIREAHRVTRPGGCVVIYAPNRLYPFETHGFYLGKRYVFGNIPLINYLPNPLRNRLAPHVRAYRRRDVRRLFDGLGVEFVTHEFVYPGFDNVAARHRALAGVLRAVLYFLETTPLAAFGLSHFVVARKLPTDRLDYAAGARLTAGSILQSPDKNPRA